MPKQESLDPVRLSRNERGIWQRRFWEHLIRDETDYARHVEYCYINPLKHGLVTRVQDWPHSSFHRDARAGIVPLDQATANRAEISASDADGTVLGKSGGLRFANPPYEAEH